MTNHFPNNIRRTKDKLRIKNDQERREKFLLFKDILRPSSNRVNCDRIIHISLGEIQILHIQIR